MRRDGRRMMNSKLYATFCLIAALAACTAPADHPALRDAELAPLMPAHRFAYQGEVLRSYQLSPDGSKLAWIGPFFMRGRLFVRDNATGEVHRYRIGDYGFQWTPDGRRVLYTSDTSGAENQHVYMIDVENPGSGEIDLTPHPGVKARIHQFVQGNSNQLLVFHNRRDARVADLYRIDLDTREETLVAKNPGDAVTAVTTPEGRILRWQRSREIARGTDERQQPFTARLATLTKSPDESFRLLGKAPGEDSVWALSNRGRDRLALVLAHRTLGWEKVIFEDPTVDVTRVTMSGITGNPLVAHSEPGYPRYEILDPALREDVAPLLQAQGSEPFGFEIVSIDRTEKRLIVLIYTSAQQRYYLIDRPGRAYTLLAESLSKDLAASLAPMEPVTIASRDGLELHGYLTLPRGAPRKGLPMVLLVHGGPWLRTTWGNPLRSEDAMYAQFLANRGYAVLQINFRGSSGYGRRFTGAAIGEFGGKMQDDLHDAMQWAVKAGIADPARVAIMGWSYGGYAALLGLATTPKTFACGVSLGGPTDLPSLIESFPPYWKTDLTAWYDYVGNPAIPDDRRHMTEKSPLHHAEKLERPVLIVQGENDVRVRPDQSVRMFDALRRAGKPVEYLAVPEMGHNIGYWAHRLAVLRATETFLRRCIGGRASRFDPFDAVAWVWTRLTREEED
jgi:dipeptidyl aminopeptidase/acylaminoacyl peptidase